ncbi:MAG TPA: DNA translocase FtsK 4TM domain-containing protein [Stellaceae bacterium]|nr:DNA translocase FtsK 4TM domain-containing protein [Stellaceae bacterium]
MTNLSSTLGRPASVSAGLRDMALRLLSGGLGVALFTGSLMLFLVLATYDPRDPSLDLATDKIPSNIGGPVGAIVADALIQTVGWASVLLPAVLAVWALRLLLNLPVRQLWVRMLSLAPLLILAAIAIGILPNGAGGVIGRLAWQLAPVKTYAFVPAMALAALSGLLLTYVLGLSRGDWREVGRGTIRAAQAGGRAGWRTIQGKAQAARQPREIAERGRERVERMGGRPAAPRAEPPPPRREPILKRVLAPGVVAAKPASPAPGKRAEALRQPMLDFAPEPAYDLPSLQLLAEPKRDAARPGPSEESLQHNALMLLSVLEDFGVKGEIVKVRPGPVVTLYELEPAPGTKSSRVIGLADDIARSMSAVSVRVAVVPGRNVIGIELPNARAETVYLRELLAAEAYERSIGRLTLVLGKDIGGGPVMADLAKMPHLLIVGTTGSGKSVGINTMILSLLYRLHPDECKFIMIDPKMLELSIYDGIPHLLAPVVTDPKKAVVALKWTVREMENRYRLMSRLGVRNIEGYNQRLAEARAKGENLSRRVQTGFDAETGEPLFEEQPLDSTPLPFIVVVVDEMADLMLVAGKDIEAAIQRLAQMARAAGIHIIMATQRPSVDVITGTIKANFPTRISFQVTSKIDSRTILGESGAEQLLGRGDMLHMAGGGRITRVHGPFVADTEVEAVVAFLRGQGSPSYVDEVTEDEEAGGGDAGPGDTGEASDDLYDRAVAIVTREKKASTSFVQRHLRIGYNRAAQIMERMEQEGVVSQANHVGKREVLAPPPR